MGTAQRQAGQWAAVGLDGQLSMDSLPYAGWSITDNITGTLTDSAAAATAMATGQKTLNGYIGMDWMGNPLVTILEQAQEYGWSVGLVTTTPITHATPAAFVAHELSRLNYSQIAKQIFEQQVNVILAGGEDDWLPEPEVGCFPNPGHRNDGRNLIEEAIADGYIYVCSPSELTNLPIESTTHILGLFADDGMTRPYTPTLSQMTSTAIAVLSQDEDGFFLMVEGGQIDWAAHYNDGENLINDVLSLDAAINEALNYAQKNPNTLIITTADHETGGMSVDLVPSGKLDEDGPFWMPDGTPFYINWTTIYHTAVDVPVTAQGPGAIKLEDTYENTNIYEVMRAFLGWRLYFSIIKN